MGANEILAAAEWLRVAIVLQPIFYWNRNAFLATFTMQPRFSLKPSDQYRR